MGRKAVILNDTSNELHHGCRTVMRNIRCLLRKRNIELIATNPSSVDWQPNKRFVEDIQKSDIVIVNGEGTLHHSQRTGLYLVKVSEYCKKLAIPVVLINSTYYRNNEEFANYTKNFDLIFVRQSLSQDELKEKNINSEVVPDMTFYDTINISEKEKTSKIGFTDTFSTELSEKLYYYSQKSKEYLYLPILVPYKIETWSNPRSVLRKIKYEAFNMVNYIKRIFFKNRLNHAYIRRFYYVESYDKYIKTIRDLNFLVTGRFHALCFALKTQTPFLALPLNSNKIEGILKDIGLNNERIIKFEDLNDELIAKYSNFNEDELAKITVYTNSAITKIERMFEKIERLTQ